MDQRSEERVLSADHSEALLAILRARFEQNARRHEGLAWEDVAGRVSSSPSALWSLAEMERTGGEPDVIGRDEQTGAYLFVDCAAESPAGRRSLCYDRAALVARTSAAPRDSAVDMAAAMGIELLTDRQYRLLQSLGAFDRKTSSWLATPPAIRSLGGALFGDRRYDTVFVYHNGASSYYAARGFRGVLTV